MIEIQITFKHDIDFNKNYIEKTFESIGDFIIIFECETKVIYQINTILITTKIPLPGCEIIELSKNTDIAHLIISSRQEFKS